MNQLESRSRFSAPVRVSVPYDVASDLGNFKKVVGSVLGKLGCQACCSGFDIHFDIERHYHIDRELNVKALSLSNGVAAGPSRTFKLDDAVANDSKLLMKAIDKIANIGGCTPCCSGHDLFFDVGRNFAFNSKLEAVGLA